jgi:hypothetical protein
MFQQMLAYFLTSIRYVNSLDINEYLGDQSTLEQNRIQLNDLFRLAYFLDEDTSLSSNQSKQTNLRQKPDIDYFDRMKR